MRNSSLSGFGGGQTELVGVSRVIQGVREFARRVARGDAKVLITGESGVGKDVVARYIHEHSTRASRAFVPVNCAGLSETLLESELFGHVRGSFTGAYRDKVGRLQLANRGTVLLDELGEMSLRMQVLLLRFLENGEIHPVGGDGVPTPIDVRIIAATNRDLGELVKLGRFREDLLYRIKVVTIHVRPLRDRREDIPALIEMMVRRLGRTLRFSESAMRMLEAYDWPGNVRELQNVVEQASWLTETEEVGVEHLSLPIAETAMPAPPAAAVAQAAQVDLLFVALSSGQQAFFDTVYPQFLRRDLTRNVLRELVRRGLTETKGNYRALLPLFGVPTRDYKRFLNFLAAHECTVDYRGYRSTASLQQFH
jgi:DNA-binding NtrC family response regulator